jgi:hypothetical protein
MPPDKMWASGPSRRTVIRCPARGKPALITWSPFPEALTVRSTSTTAPAGGGSGGGPGGPGTGRSQAGQDPVIKPRWQGLDPVPIQQNMDPVQPSQQPGPRRLAPAPRPGKDRTTTPSWRHARPCWSPERSPQRIATAAATRCHRRHIRQARQAAAGRRHCRSPAPSPAACQPTAATPNPRPDHAATQHERHPAGARVEIRLLPPGAAMPAPAAGVSPPVRPRR